MQDRVAVTYCVVFTGLQTAQRTVKKKQGWVHPVSRETAAAVLPCIAARPVLRGVAA